MKDSSFKTQRKVLGRILVDEYHGEQLFSPRLVNELRGYGFGTVRFTEPYTYVQLAEYDILAIWFTRYFEGQRAQFTEADKQIIRQYLKDGGSALLIGLGWAWTEYEDRPSINEYPLNFITEPHGIFFTAAKIDTVAGVHYKQSPVSFSRPFMANHPVTVSVNQIGSPDSVPASLVVSGPAIRLVWGDNETYDADGAKNPVILAATNIGNGRVICLQHAGYITHMGYDNFTLLRNILTWLVGKEDSRAELEHVDAGSIMKSRVIEITDKGLESTPTIGIITALPKEFAAMRAMLENVRTRDKPARDGQHRYFIGEIPISENRRHQVVVALMPDMGNNSASSVASRLLVHFPSVKDIIMVGIAGGTPNVKKPNEHVRLGDVVVSDRNGVVEYDLVKEEIQEIKHRYPPRPPSARLLTAVSLLEADELAGERPWLKHIEKAAHLFNSSRPLKERDILRDFAYPNSPMPIDHPHDPRRTNGEPRVFLGTIASANTLLKNPVKRDALRDQFGVKAVEMEGSGVADAAWSEGAGYLVVRGICDYCDPDKTDEWQEYAAVVAAAYTRGLIELVPVNNLEGEANPKEPCMPQPKLLRRSEQVLQECEEFDTNQELRAVFNHPDLRPWQNFLPDAGNKAMRVMQTVSYLQSKRRGDGRYALVLLLERLRDLRSGELDLYRELDYLAQCWAVQLEQK